jgi:hypothetical protein
VPDVHPHDRWVRGGFQRPRPCHVPRVRSRDVGSRGAGNPEPRVGYHRRAMDMTKGSAR